MINTCFQGSAQSSVFFEVEIKRKSHSGHIFPGFFVGCHLSIHHLQTAHTSEKWNEAEIAVVFFQCVDVILLVVDRYHNGEPEKSGAICFHMHVVLFIKGHPIRFFHSVSSENSSV